MDLDRLQREMQQAFNFPSNIRGRSWDTYPATNVGHTPNSVEIFVFLPGVEPSQIELHLEKGVLVVAGQRNIDVADKDEKAVMHIEERFAGQFRRVVTLPDDIDPNQVDARYRDGVLHICIQRREAATPRQITIQ
jgi:HSP20 family protein